VSTEKTPGQVAYEAGIAAMAAAAPERYRVTDFSAWEELTAAERDFEEVKAQAVLDSRTPWGDANAVSVEMHPLYAVVRSGAADGEVVKVISHGEDGLRYYGSLEEGERAYEDEQRAAVLRRAGLLWEENARDMAAEDGDLDNCEPTL
jgi:hypothetical protein